VGTVSSSLRATVKLVLGDMGGTSARPRQREHGAADEASAGNVGVVLCLAVVVAMASTQWVIVHGFHAAAERPIARFAVRAVDLPSYADVGADTDIDRDALEVVLTSNDGALAPASVGFSLDGVLVTYGAGQANRWGPCTSAALCSSVLGGNGLWAEGDPVYLWKGTPTTVASLQGQHEVKVLVDKVLVAAEDVRVEDNGATSPVWPT
jgi:hypothetical protein